MKLYKGKIGGLIISLLIIGDLCFNNLQYTTKFTSKTMDIVISASRKFGEYISDTINDIILDK